VFAALCVQTDVLRQRYFNFYDQMVINSWQSYSLLCSSWTKECIYIFIYLFIDVHEITLINLHSKLCVIVVLYVCTNKLYILNFIICFYIIFVVEKCNM